MTLYVFDMDGTLTPARLEMTADFAERFHQWQQTHKSFIATGSDYAKVEEQLPLNVIYAFTGIYCSMGNVLKVRDESVYEKAFVPEKSLIERLEYYRNNTRYPDDLFDNYIEVRTGMVNFSVLGRDCPYAKREFYADWDKTAGERLKIQKELQTLFPEYEIAVGGSISMDITLKGCGKSQIAHHLRQTYPDEEIVFFGDRTFEGGNDYELARELLTLTNTRVVQVENPDEVLEILGA